MGKPISKLIKRFRNGFIKSQNPLEKEQYLVPYLMSSHPGSTLKDAVALALFLKQENLHRTGTGFYPTPGTISTCMFYTELNPYTLEKVYVPKTDKEKSNAAGIVAIF